MLKTPVSESLSYSARAFAFLTSCIAISVGVLNMALGFFLIGLQ